MVDELEGVEEALADPQLALTDQQQSWVRAGLYDAYDQVRMRCRVQYKSIAGAGDVWSSGLRNHHHCTAALTKLGPRAGSIAMRVWAR